MSAEVIAQLILTFGVPLAEQFYKMFSGTGPTQADWDALKALANQRSADKMMQALIANGIDPASAQGKAFLALVQ